MNVVRTAQTVVAALAMTALGTCAAQDASAGALSRSDHATVTGADFVAGVPADIVAGSPHNDLLVTYQVGHRVLSDATVRITFPARQWPTTLLPMDAAMPAGYTPPGAFTAEPNPGDPHSGLLGAAQCDPLPGGLAVQDDDDGDQVIVVPHVTCAAHQSLAVLVNGVATPSAAGSYDLPVQAEDARSGQAGFAAVQVRPAPRTALRLAPIATVVAPGVPMTVTVTAVGPDGHVAKHYRGAVSVTSTDTTDCSMAPQNGVIAHRFTASDAGVAQIAVTLNSSYPHRLIVSDVANRAAPAISNDFVVDGIFPNHLVCPVSYN